MSFSLASKMHHGRRGAGKKVNILTFIPRGFKHSVDIQFPDRRLPVCDRCKRYYKTRECCRVRDGHTALPWSLSYVCMTLDPTCTDSNGKLVDASFYARTLPDQPYIISGDIDPFTPICTLCKDKNYTRSYCRSKKKHPYLPWSTVHVILSRKPDSGLHPNDLGRSEKEEKSAKKRKIEKDSPSKSSENEDEEEPEEVKIKGDTFDHIPPSRTFLVHISKDVNEIYWLDIDESVTSVGNGFVDNQLFSSDPAKMFYLQASQQFPFQNGTPNAFRQASGMSSTPHGGSRQDMYGASPYGMMQPGGPQGNISGLSNQESNGFPSTQDGALAMNQMNQQFNMPHMSPGSNPQQRMNAQRNNQLWMNRQMQQHQMWGMMDRDLNDPQYYQENLREAALMNQQANPFTMGNLSLHMEDNGMYQQQANGGNAGIPPQAQGFINRNHDERNF